MAHIVQLIDERTKPDSAMILNRNYSSYAPESNMVTPLNDKNYVMELISTNLDLMAIESEFEADHYKLSNTNTYCPTPAPASIHAPTPSSTPSSTPVREIVRHGYSNNMRRDSLPSRPMSAI